MTESIIKAAVTALFEPIRYTDHNGFSHSQQPIGDRMMTYLLQDKDIQDKLKQVALNLLENDTVFADHQNLVQERVEAYISQQVLNKLNGLFESNYSSLRGYLDNQIQQIGQEIIDQDQTLREKIAAKIGQTDFTLTISIQTSITQ